MLIAFGKKKCPICGNFGNKIKTESLHCIKCDVAFDEFRIHTDPEIEVEEKTWN